MKKFKSVLGVYILLVVLLALFIISGKGQYSTHDILNMIRQASPLGIVAIAQTLVLLIGGIDLSVGAVISLVNIVSAAIMNGNSGNMFMAVMVSLVISLVIGLINGIAVAKFKIPAFLVTLAMSIFIEGAYLLYTQGTPKGSIATSFRYISDGWLGGFFPLSLLIWILIWIVFAYFLNYHTFGKKLYATGGNPVTSWLSGIKVNKITVGTYVLCSLLSGVAGLMLSAFIGTASSGVGDSYTLNSIAATVIGGTSFVGGIGGLSGTFAGVLIMTVIQNFLTVENIPTAGQFITQGVIIILMIAINQRKKV